MRMPFGKHRGKLLGDVPSSYLYWLIRECDLDPPLREAVEHELRERFGQDDEAPRSPPGNSTDRDSRAVVEVRSVLKSWYRQMAMKYHPDRTLDDGTVMKAINDGYERLQALFGVSR